jgi:hypothetical protein
MIIMVYIGGVISGYSLFIHCYVVTAWYPPPKNWPPPLVSALMSCAGINHRANQAAVVVYTLELPLGGLVTSREGR